MNRTPKQSRGFLVFCVATLVTLDQLEVRLEGNMAQQLSYRRRQGRSSRNLLSTLEDPRLERSLRKPL